MQAKVRSGSLRALVIDDQRDISRITAMLLRGLGCDAWSLSEPGRAIEIASTIRPQIIVLDLAMPNVNGLDVARSLRAAGLPPFLLVAQTGYTQSELRQQCLDAGFDDILVKPVSLDDFRRVLASARELAAPLR